VSASDSSGGGGAVQRGRGAFRLRRGSDREGEAGQSEIKRTRALPAQRSRAERLPSRGEPFAQAGLRLAVAIGVVMIAAGCGKRGDDAGGGDRSVARDVAAYPASPFLNARPGVAYVGDEKCAQCHGSLVDSYHHHGMARTFAPAAGEELTGDWSGAGVVHHSPSNFTYTMIERDGRRFVRETRADSTGRTIHDVEKEIDFLIGSGDNDQGFGYEEAGGLYVLPVEWYRGKKIWDMAPGFESARQERWKRQLLPGCIGCHASYPDYVADSGNRYGGALPVGIGCERCHGPGALHVAKHLSASGGTTSSRDGAAGGARSDGGGAGGAIGAFDSTIVNPERLPRARQVEICAQCHLQADVRRPRAGRGEFDFRPGLPLGEFKELYVPAVEDTLLFGFVRHVERMVQSRCFVASDSMTCTTCHDPHTSSRGQTAAYWRERCQSCHAAADCPVSGREGAMGGARGAMSETAHGAPRGDGPDCVVCHMRRSQPFDVLHVAITDHWIRRRIDPPAEFTETRTRARDGVPLVPFSLDGAPAETTAAFLAGLGIAHVAIGQDGRALDFLDRALAMDVPENLRSEAHLQRAIALAHLNRKDDAFRDLDEAVRLGPESAESAFRLGQTNLEAGRPREAAAAFRAGIARYDGDALAWVSLAMALAGMDSLDAGLEAARRAVALHPGSDAAQRTLGTMLVALGRNDEAHAPLREAIRLTPDDGDAWLAVGAIAAARGNGAEAIDAWREAARILPRTAEPWRRIASLASASGDGEAALAAQWEAVRRAQDDPAGWIALGDLLGRAGKFREAIVALRHATAIEPRAVAAWGNMALAYTELGETQTARALLDTVLALDPNSPKARALKGRIEELEALN